MTPDLQRPPRRFRPLTRPTRGRAAAVLALLVLLPLLVPLVRGYRTLCTQPVDTYYAIAAARDEARRAAQSSPESPPGSAPVAGTSSAVTQWLAGLRAVALDRFLAVKQSDHVAFPAHALAGAALELGRCPAHATGDQWRKAAAHARFDWWADLAAAGLARTSIPAFGMAAVSEELRRYAAAEPWHAPNLARVEAALKERFGRDDTLGRSSDHGAGRRAAAQRLLQ